MRRYCYSPCSFCLSICLCPVCLLSQHRYSISSFSLFLSLSFQPANDYYSHQLFPLSLTNPQTHTYTGTRLHIPTPPIQSCQSRLTSRTRIQKREEKKNKFQHKERRRKTRPVSPILSTFLSPSHSCIA
ncbi:hypothetical protein COCSADRAFT_277480 [Bipolaris sorokiniana ND90Pr]|uniref:Secreted protein n=1 Tax=Cochliobolus sativus (strain ND90Pr / ATCC 201652) TaxID=665912 RepID=M2TJI5_COCSN|nr:uncharacterized protein COCSADRAFT_277480 [Bipolaris sorokiniana ND90Pr]EMD68862.1 hypothetical protein COCSADRAFT_277480 [Bipolaris sorokiniana ND90Pr]